MMMFKGVLQNNTSKKFWVKNIGVFFVDKTTGCFINQDFFGNSTNIFEKYNELCEALQL